MVEWRVCCLNVASTFFSGIQDEVNGDNKQMMVKQNDNNKDLKPKKTF